MKRVTASEARRDWFRLLDEVLGGEIVVIERNGRRIVIRREEPERASRRKLPDYSDIIRIPNPGAADTWRWQWRGPEADLSLEESDE